MDFSAQLKMTFLNESMGMLDEAENACMDMETSTSHRDNLNLVFRIFHNIKGSSTAVGCDGVGAFAHSVENLLTLLKESNHIISSDIIGVLLESLDLLRAGIKNECDGMGFPAATSLVGQVDRIIKRIQSKDLQKKADPFEKPDSTKENPTIESDGFQVFDDNTEESIQAYTSESYNNGSSPELIDNAESMKASASRVNSAKSEVLKVPLDRVEMLINYVGEMAILGAVLKEQSSTIKSPLIKNTIVQLGKVSKEVQDISMMLRMVPLTQTFQKMKRIVRDTAASTGKKVSFSIIGEEAEVDKSIVEKISDPLVHIIRNAVDHGIESPDAREKVGKDKTGQVKVSAYQQSGKFVIDIYDDGSGIDTQRLRQLTYDRKLHPDPFELTEDEAANLIFLPGLSTKKSISDISGRGVGMDVVKSNIDKINGEIHLTSNQGVGTQIKITLPQSLAIIETMVVLTSNQRFVVPISMISETIQISKNCLRKTSSLGEILLFRGENIPFYRLSRILQIKECPIGDIEKPVAIIVRNSVSVFAIMVEEIIGQYQVVVKNLGYQVDKTPGIIGSAILGDGKPSLILELDELIDARGFQIQKVVHGEEHQANTAGDDS